MSGAPSLSALLDILVEARLLHTGQKQDVLNRGKEQARHLLLDRRAELRRLLGRQRVSYSLSDIELIASFRFKRADTDQPLEEETITEAVARALGYAFTRVDPIKLDFKLVVDAFGGPFAERHLVIAIDDAPECITVAVADPWNTELLGSLASFKQKPIRPVMAPKSEILRVIAEFHGFRRSMRAAEVELGGEFPDIGNLESLYKVSGTNELEATDQPVVQAVWYLLNYAYDQRVSDIHIEPKREDALVRMRIDGVLHGVHRMPKAVHPAVVSRVKLLARLDIAEKRRPQDGRFKTQFGKDEVEIRVSTVPTAFGEKAVLRIFDPSVLRQPLPELGLFERELAMYEGFVRATNGLVLITGPTGSGKTTTLYSTLHHIHSPRINICTLEDPIEMVHESFTQIAMQPKIGLTFGSALRNVLRQDPDVVMVGEIRDPETAEGAVQAAMTGHLVLSTLHTNDAPSAVGRLLDLGVYPFLISGTLLGVVAQRLVRRVCGQCGVDDVLTNEQIEQLGILGAEGRRLKVRRGTGCVRCRGTGYRGRVGIFEVLRMTPRIQKLVQERAPAQDIKREALNDGMLTLREYAIKKMARGETTFEEVLAMTDETALYG
jgi:general secretion pathway protein E